MTGRRVAVFGGSAPRPGDEGYQQAFLLGQLLAEAGHTVLNGGYIGTMEAVSRGAAEAGGYVIGYTCEEIERWRKVSANPWIHEERHYPSLRLRLLAIMDDCEAAIALPGGVGTLAEISTTWNHILTTAIPARPLILIGSEWQSVIQQFFTQMDTMVPENQRSWVSFAADVQAAVAMLDHR